MICWTYLLKFSQTYETSTSFQINIHNPLSSLLTSSKAFEFCWRSFLISFVSSSRSSLSNPISKLIPSSFDSSFEESFGSSIPPGTFLSLTNFPF